MQQEEGTSANIISFAWLHGAERRILFLPLQAYLTTRPRCHLAAYMCVSCPCRSCAQP